MSREETRATSVEEESAEAETIDEESVEEESAEAETIDGEPVEEESAEAKTIEPGSDVFDPATDGEVTIDPAPDLEESDAGVEADDDESADAADDGDFEVARTPGEEEEYGTGRWTIGLSLAMVAGGAGVVLNSPAMFLSAVVGLVYAAYGYATRPPSLTVLVDREVSDASPLPGDLVEVTVTLENVGDRNLPDLRVVDDVPEDMPVVEGSPSTVTSLQPGDEATFTYALRARRGSHEFGGTRVISRNLSGATERRRKLENERTVACQARLDDLPLEALTIPFTGRVETNSGGEGLEFWSTRKYTHGDPMRRIDWNRYARSNELTTINYRQTEAATVVVLVDDRSESKVSRRPGEPHSLELCRHAGQLIAGALLEKNNRVGVAMYGDGTYLTQGGGKAQAIRVERLLEEGPEDLDAEGKHVRMAYGGEHARTLRRHFPDNAQVVFVTPLLDDAPVEIASRLEAHGHEVTIVSPDVTTASDPGGTISRLERDDRVRTVRQNRTRVVDWSPDDPLQAAVKRALERWSR